MPELPEVETIRRGLTPLIKGQKITKIDVLCDKSFIGTFLPGKVTNLRRFGKALIIDLDNGTSLMIHLRMTGQLIYDGKVYDEKTRYAAGHPSDNFVDTLPNRQTRVILHFDNGSILYFNDQRKFGFIKVVKTADLLDEPFIKKLAKEPWEITEVELYKKFIHHPKMSIKAALLDQTIIAGLGNIYVDETLFLSKIHPTRRVETITQSDTRTILESAKTVMEKSINSGGSTMATYIKPDGTRGDYLEKFAQVFRKDGEKCPVCGTKIVKIRVAGRGTHLCPNCQKEPK